MQLKSENGSALVTVLILIATLMVISNALLTAYVLHNRLARKEFNRLRAFYLAEAGIYKTLWYLSGHEGHDLFWRPSDERIEVIDDETVEITVQEWGGFLEVISKANYKKQQQKLRVLIGQNLPASFYQAIIIGGVDFPLVVTGTNQIIGDVTVGAGGVKTGVIKGIKFYGNKPVDGKIHRQSPPQMPFFDPHFFSRAIKRFNQWLENPPDFQYFFVQGRMNSATLKDSLLSKPGIIFCKGNLNLYGSAKFVNPVQIIVQGKIEISDEVFFNNALIFSRQKIVLSGHVRGSLQLITPGDIILQENVQLQYPSVLFTSGRKVENRWTGSIKIKKGSRVTGTVILMEVIPDSFKQISRAGQISVNSGAQVTGLIYSTNRATINGRVHGMVITNHFYLYETPTTYINWLKDAYINRKKLGSGFKLPLFFSNPPSLEIVIWE
ncbi:MAG: hypothetical protein D6813_06745 [Calditrichaeota bacterium]|nr:MAG: hypothetical protein D6813_06745 [Calditrichota bacterium]